MKDRIVQYPNRVRLTPVQGTTNEYEMERVSGIVTEQGTKLNKANLLRDEVATKLGLDDTATPNDAFDKLADSGASAIGDIKLSLNQQGNNYMACDGSEIDNLPQLVGKLPMFKTGASINSNYAPTYDNEYIAYIDTSNTRLYYKPTNSGEVNSVRLENVLNCLSSHESIEFAGVDRVNNNWFVLIAYDQERVCLAKSSDLEDWNEYVVDLYDIGNNYNKTITQWLRYNGTNFEWWYETVENGQTTWYKTYKITAELNGTITPHEYISKASAPSSLRYEWTHCNGRCYLNENTTNIYYEVELEGKVIRERMGTNIGGAFYVDNVMIYNDVKAITKVNGKYYIVRYDSVMETQDFVSFVQVQANSNGWKANNTEPFGANLDYVSNDGYLCDTIKQTLPNIQYGWLKINN